MFSYEIPEQMQPNTIIEFIDGEHYKIIQGGISTECVRKMEQIEIEALHDANLDESIFEEYQAYPIPEKGMIIIYGTNGHLVDIEYPDGYIPKFEKNTAIPKMNMYSLINPTDGQLRMNLV